MELAQADEDAALLKTGHGCCCCCFLFVFCFFLVLVFFFFFFFFWGGGGGGLLDQDVEVGQADDHVKLDCTRR